MQNDLISRSALVEHIKERACDVWNQNTRPISWTAAYEQFVDDLEDAPAVDAEKVVRCKDCKHWDVDPDTYGNAFGPEGCCFGIADGSTLTKHDDFCSWGERRSDDG